MPDDTSLMDSPDAFDGPEDDEVTVIPITRQSELIMVSNGLREVQRHMDKATQINQDLGQLIAADNGIQLVDGDQVRFAESDDGKISLCLLLKPRA